MPDFHGVTPSGRHGSNHAKMRERLFRQLPEYSPCARCGEQMWKFERDATGRSAVHLDHNDDNTGYIGFAHARCNRRDGASKGARAANAQRSHHRWRPVPVEDPVDGGPGTVGW